MSRSKRKTPIMGLAGDSDKEGKKQANKKLRRKTKLKLHTDSEVLPILREVSDVWGMPKDGKRFCRTEKDMRK